MTSTPIAVGIDVGGTHTDIVATNPDGAVAWADKVPSNPEAQLEAITAALETIPGDGPIELCVNGTTVAINALLQRRLPSVALVATRGFGDMLYIRRETKANIYDLDWRKPAPFVPRSMTREIGGRIDSEGQVIEELESLDPLLEWIAGEEIDDIAVCLIHAYRNPAHEHAVRDAILAARPGARVTLSSDVWPEWREFERTYNTVLNAALKPVTARYVEGLVTAVRNVAGHDRVYLMHADGGVLGPGEITERPVLTLLSGTVAGALMGAKIAADSGFDHAVSLDMGGTSTDISLSQFGQPRRSAELSIEWEGLLGFAGIDVASIGAGGGSVVWMDEAGGMYVGPRSMGSDPGPAAFDRGGTTPTLTDAYLLLGYLGREPTIGSSRLSVDRARASFESLVERSGLEEKALCAGFYEIANANLAAGIRRTTIERGVDPRSCALICFGGAGPLHAASLVKELALASAVIPARPGNASALGLLLAPIKHSVSQTHYAPLEDLPSPEFEQLQSDLRTRATAALPSANGAGPEYDLEWFMSLRYRGQTRELTIRCTQETLDNFDDRARGEIAAAFHERHEEEFTFSATNEPIVLVTLRCDASVRGRKIGERFGVVDDAHAQDGTERAEESIEMWFLSARGEEPERCEATALSRNSLKPGDEVAGPAVVLDVGSNILLPPGTVGSVDAGGNMVIEWSEGRS